MYKYRQLPSQNTTARDPSLQIINNKAMLSDAFRLNYARANNRRRSGILQPESSFIDRLGYVRRDSIENAPFSTRSRLNAKDRELLAAVNRGDLPTVRRLLERTSILQQRRGSYASLSDSEQANSNNNTEEININCTDALGRSSLRIAIENENLELVELLLRYEHIDIADALLHAIQNESLGSVILLLNRTTNLQSNKKNLSTILGEIPSTSFTADITPIILAAMKDNYTIIHLLLENGFSIPRPHEFRCVCEQCYSGSSKNSLGLSRKRLNIYSALASPSLICLTSRDPLLTAFELSSQLRGLARLEVEFSVDYDRLAAQCRKFAVDLLDQVRDSSELSIILNYDPELRYFEERRRALLWKRNSLDSNNSNNSGEPEEETYSLARLKLAIKFKQKQFIAHPSCQQFLSSIWYSSIPGFRQMSIIGQFTVLITLGLLWPLLCVVNMFLPNSKVGRLIRQPFVKFVCHAASYLLFLILLMMASQRFDIRMLAISDSSARKGAAPTSTEWIIFVFVVASVWADAKALGCLGLQDYVRNRWHLFTFVINGLFVCVIFLRAVTYHKRVHGNSPYDSLPRRQWHSFDPDLVAESIFAVASVFSCLKLISIFTVSSKIGPLQIAFGRMLIDIAKFGIVYAVLLMAFSCGLSQVYWFYAYYEVGNADATDGATNSFGKDDTNSSTCCCATQPTLQPNSFGRMFDILQSLYWGLFSLIDLNTLDLMGDHKLTAFIAKLLFGSYTFMGVIVLVNALIAMMSDSYKKIQRQSDVEWKFALAKLWLSYFEDIYELPIPFNLLPSVSSFKDMNRAISDLRRFLYAIRLERQRSTDNVFRDNEDLFIDEIIARTQDRTFRYQQVIRELAKRYLIKRQENQQFAGVTEDDLAEIKQDISSFKYELLEILRYNDMKIPEYIQQSPASTILSPTTTVLSGNPLINSNNDRPLLSVSSLGNDNVINSRHISDSSIGRDDPMRLGRRHSIPMASAEQRQSETSPHSSMTNKAETLSQAFLLMHQTRRQLSHRRRSRRGSLLDVALDQRLFSTELASQSQTRLNSSDNTIFTISETVDF